MKKSHRNLLGPMLQQYFCHYLIGQRNVSAQTVSAYRDTFKLLIRFLEQRRHIKVETLCVTDLDAPCILKFLEDLERRRGNGPRTRNARLAAIRSFIRYAASAEPLLLPEAQRLLAIPVKRFEHPYVGYLTQEQIQSLLDAPNSSSRIGLRDSVLLMLLYNTGARVSEITGLRVGDLRLESGGLVHIRGKGRKQRSLPLWRETVQLLRQWLKQTDASPEKPLLPNARGGFMTRAGLVQRISSEQLSTRFPAGAVVQRLWEWTFVSVIWQRGGNLRVSLTTKSDSVLWQFDARHAKAAGKRVP